MVVQIVLIHIQLMAADYLSTTVTNRYGKAELNYVKSGDGFLAAISRKDLDMTALHKYKVCEMYFHSRKPAYLYNTTNPYWLPILNLGHKEHGSAVTTRLEGPSVDRYRRAQEKEKWKRIEELLPALITEEMQLIIAEEIRLLAAEQIETARQHIRPVDHHECLSKIEALQTELAKRRAPDNVQTSDILQLKIDKSG